mmetsp:Transcript_46598/g.74931  ORF Transcript_46598/g.74931 Transcript_46598/m.74931 type:complete len:613 (-) Transcript_46598:247-2085(-)
MDAKTIKLALPNGDIRRIRLEGISGPDKNSYVELLRKVSNLGSNEDNKAGEAASSVRLKYKDDEGDLVTIESAEELAYAFSTVKSESVLKIHLEHIFDPQEDEQKEAAPEDVLVQSVISYNSDDLLLAEPVRDEAASLIEEKTQASSFEVVKDEKEQETTDWGTVIVDVVTPVELTSSSFDQTPRIVIPEKVKEDSRDEVKVDSTVSLANDAIKDSVDSQVDKVPRIEILSKMKREDSDDLNEAITEFVDSQIEEVMTEFLSTDPENQIIHDSEDLVTTEVKHSDKLKDLGQDSSSKSEEAKSEEFAVGNVRSLGASFLRSKSFSKVLAKNMEKIMNLTTSGRGAECLQFIREKASEDPELVNHPFYQAVLPHFAVLQQIFVSNITSLSETLLVMASALDGSKDYNRIHDEFHEKKDDEISPKTHDDEVHRVEKKCKMERDNVRDSHEVCRPPSKSLLPLQSLPDTKMGSEEKGEAIKSGVESQTDTILVVGKGNHIKWKFDEGIPSIKFFKHGWNKSAHPTLRHGDRLVRINDIWIQTFDRETVQKTWLSENGGSARLYFQTLDQVHPCEKYHDQLQVLANMGFLQTKRNRALLEINNGQCQAVIDTLLKK